MLTHMQANKSWVRSKKGKSDTTDDSSSNQAGNQQTGKQISRQTGPKAKGVAELDDCDKQLVVEDDINLIFCEVGEEKKLEVNPDVVYFNEETDVIYEREILLGESREVEIAARSVSTGLQSRLFDDAPGFETRSPKWKKMKSKKERIGNPSNDLNKDVFSVDISSQKTDYHGISVGENIGWVKFEENGKYESRFEGSSPGLGELSGSEMSDQAGHTSRIEGISVSSTPTRQADWVSFEGDGGIRQRQELEKYGALERREEVFEYQSPLSSSVIPPYSSASSVMLSATLISDVYDMADDFSESKNQTLVDLGENEKISDQNKNVSMERVINDYVDEKDNFETDSNFSGEICDLNNIENDSLLRDTRKPFPKEGIFQASSIKKKGKKETEKPSQSTPKRTTKELCLEENNCSPLDDYPALSNRTEWVFMYRYPDKKRKFGSRKWLPVRLEVKDDAIKITGRLESTEILKEIPLHPFFVFTMPVLHDGDGHEKLHSVKLQYVKYKEMRKIASKFHLEHIPSYTPVLKLASKDCKAMKEFVETVENVVRKIETHRDKGITHRHEEIFIDCDDICQYELDGDGKVKRYNITCQIRLRAFITGIPNLYLFLNDIMAHNKQKARRTDGKQPRCSRWIKLENTEYHPSVDVDASVREGGVVFKPPDACSFELMRFRVRNTRELPMFFKGTIDFTTSKSFQIKAECKVAGEGRVMKYRRNGIVVKFPIPTTWTSVFVKSRSFSGQKKYVQARADQRTFASGIGRTARCFIEVSTGTAKYEPEYGAVVWRVGDLPILASGVPADAVQTFDLQVNLPFEIDLPKTLDLYAEVEYEIPHATGSEIQIQEVLLSDGRTPDKWVCYRAIYSYKILMNVTNRKRLGDAS